MEKYSSCSYTIGFVEAMFLNFKSLSEHHAVKYITAVKTFDGSTGDNEVLEYIEKTYHLTLTNNNL